MAKKVFGSFLIMLFTILVVLFFKTGAYKSVEVSTETVPAPNLNLFYVENIGPYHQIVEKIKFVEDKFKNSDTPCTKTFGLFISDPEIIEHEKLISHVGCAFYEAESPILIDPTGDIQEAKYGLDEKNCYMGTFKGSPSLSAMKIYPKLQAAAQRDRVKLKTKALEVYHVEGNSVTTDVYLCVEED